jgi:hypothetical protein
VPEGSNGRCHDRRSSSEIVLAELTSLQTALLDRLSDAERKAWRRFAARVQRYEVRQAAKYAREYEARVKRAQQRLAGG